MKRGGSGGTGYDDAMRRTLWLGLLAAAAFAQETLSDDWNLMRIAGQDVGYVHTRTVQRGDIVETVIETKLLMKRAGAEMSVEQTETTEERAADGTLVRMSSKRKMSMQEMETAVRFEGGKAILSTKVMGQTRESTIDVPADLLGPYRIDRLSREAKAGTTVEAKTYLSDLNGPATIRVTVGKEEEVDLLDGKKERLVRVETVFQGLPLKPTSWMDAKGRTRKTVTNVAGLQMETYLVTEERARRAAAGGEAPPPDVFTPTMLPAPHPIPCPRRLDRATYRVRAKEEMPAFADDRQSVEKADDGTVILRIERKVPPEGHTGTRPIAKPPAELATSLAANSMVQSDAPEIVAVACDVVGSETDAWKAAQKLERWVKENVTNKNLDVGFASALEVVRDRQGDCTEHSVLLCALCRAAGIPARCAMGVLGMGPAWAGHAWNEVWIDGKWYALDGTLGQGSVDPCHITLSRMTLKDTGFAEEFLGLMQGLGNLEIDATEIVLDGRTIRPGDDPALIDGDRYENAVWGIRFACPKGWKWKPPAASTGMATDLMGLESATGRKIGIGVLATAGDDDWEQVGPALEKAYGTVEKTKVGGRPALRVTPKEGGRRLFALGRNGLFLFDLDPAAGEAEAAAFEALLASVDFGVK